MTLSSRELKRLAAEAGFDLCGVAPATELDGFGPRLERWLDEKMNGTMGYMERNAAMRADPRLLVPDARSVISVAVAYKPDRTMCGRHKIAQYAYGRDYHEVLKERLHHLIAMLRERWPSFEAKACVDTVPISDKLWAARAGLGWIGRNTLLVTPQFGSYVNLGELVTTSEFDTYDTPIENQCGDCHRCVDACPNHALDRSESLGLAATQCTAYQTIERDGVVLRSALHRPNYVFGCDSCQLACPWCASSPAVRTVTDQRMSELEALPDASESDFRRLTAHTPLSRITYTHWRENCGNQTK